MATLARTDPLAPFSPAVRAGWIRSHAPKVKRNAAKISFRTMDIWSWLAANGFNGGGPHVQACGNQRYARRG